MSYFALLAWATPESCSVVAGGGWEGGRQRNEDSQKPTELHFCPPQIPIESISSWGMLVN